MKNWMERKDVVAIVTLLATGLTFRLYGAFTVPPDLDELFQLFIASRPSFHELIQAIYSLGPQQYPLDYFLSFITFRFTDSLTLLRLLPVFLGALAIVQIYFLGRRLIDRTFGWIWAWLLTLSILHIEFSVTFRYYSLIVFLSCAALHAFIYVVQEGCGIKRYVIVTTLYQLVYPFALVKNGCDLAVGAIKKFGLSRLVLMALPILIPLAHWCFVGHKLVHASTFHYEMNDAVAWNTLKFFLMKLNQSNRITFFIFSGLFCLGIIRGVSDPRYRPAIFYSVTLMTLTLVAVVASIYRSHLFFHPRHAIIVLPLYLGIVAFGFHEIVFFFKKSQRWVVLFSLVTLIGAVKSFAFFLTERKNTATTFHAHLDYIAQHGSSGDVLIFSNPGYAATFAYSFDRSSFFTISKIVLSNGMDLFLLPKPLRMVKEPKSFDVYVVAHDHEEVATIDANTFKQLNGNVWLLNSTFNHFQEPNPLFTELGVSRENLDEPVLGLFFLRRL